MTEQLQTNEEIARAEHVQLVTEAPTPGELRLLAQLKRELGVVADLLNEPLTIEVMLNPDGNLWVERLGQGMERVGRMERTQATKLTSQIANLLEKGLNDKFPMLQGELPGDGSRIQILVPPIVRAPSFCIRRPASRVFTLQEYVQSGSVTETQAEFLRGAVQSKKNILVAGGTGSGKTTFCNAVLDEVAKAEPECRAYVIEDTRELQVNVANKTSVVAVREINMTMQVLLFAALRYRPDRIIVGEVRDGAAATLVDAWGTGHPGGIGTLHADSAQQAMKRLEVLVRQAGVPAEPSVLAYTVNVVAFMSKTSVGRKLEELVEVTGYDEVARKYLFNKIV